MVGEEALSEDKAQALLGAGHEVTPTWRRLKWPSRGVLASTKRIVGEHFEYVRPTAISKPMWACLHCSWSNTMRGFIRTLYMRFPYTPHECFFWHVKNASVECPLGRLKSGWRRGT